MVSLNQNKIKCENKKSLTIKRSITMRSFITVQLYEKEKEKNEKYRRQNSSNHGNYLEGKFFDTKSILQFHFLVLFLVFRSRLNFIGENEKCKV